MPTKPNLSRVQARPDPAQWAPDELLTLPEAALLMWPNGPLRAASLPTAARDGRLAITVVAGKHLTTKAALSELSVCTPRSDEAASLDGPLSEKNVFAHIAAAGRRASI